MVVFDTVLPRLNSLFHFATTTNYNAAAADSPAAGSTFMM